MMEKTKPNKGTQVPSERIDSNEETCEAMKISNVKHSAIIAESIKHPSFLSDYHTCVEIESTNRSYQFYISIGLYLLIAFMRHRTDRRIIRVILNYLSGDTSDHSIAQNLLPIRIKHQKKLISLLKLCEKEGEKCNIFSVFTKTSRKQALISWVKNIAVNCITDDKVKKKLRGINKDGFELFEDFSNALQAKIIIDNKSEAREYEPDNGLLFAFPIRIAELNKEGPIYLLLHNDFYNSPYVYTKKLPSMKPFLRTLASERISRAEIVCKIIRMKEDAKIMKKELIKEKDNQFKKELKDISCLLARKLENSSELHIKNIEELKSQEELIKCIKSLIEELNERINTKIKEEPITMEDHRKLIEKYFIIEEMECIECEERKEVILKLIKGSAPSFEFCKKCFMAEIPKILEGKSFSHPKASEWLKEFNKQGYTLQQTEHVEKGLTDNICRSKKSIDESSRNIPPCSECPNESKKEVIELFDTCAIIKHHLLCLDCWKKKLIPNKICHICCCIVEASWIN